MLNFRRIFAAAVLTAAPIAASAQTPPAAPAPQTPSPSATPARVQQTVCGLPIPEPSRLPPANSSPVVFQVVPCFQKQGGFSVIDANTYLYYIEMTRNVS